MDDDVEEKVYVKMMVTFTVADYPGVPHVVTHHLVDTAPDFEKSSALLNTFSGLDSPEILIWHEDLPEPQTKRPTHPPAIWLQ